MQLHGMVLATFASLIAPFGGFFASGLKRTFKIKDFGDSIPGHGGMTDRMDCQFIMGFFAYMYYHTFIAVYKVTLGSVIETAITSLSPDEQVELVKGMARYLGNQGVVPEKVSRNPTGLQQVVADEIYSSWRASTRPCRNDEHLADRIVSCFFASTNFLSYKPFRKKVLHWPESVGVRASRTVPGMEDGMMAAPGGRAVCCLAFAFETPVVLLRELKGLHM